MISLHRGSQQVFVQKIHSSDFGVLGNKSHTPGCPKFSIAYSVAAVSGVIVFDQPGFGPGMELPGYGFKSQTLAVRRTNSSGIEEKTIRSTDSVQFVKRSLEHTGSQGGI